MGLFSSAWFWLSSHKNAVLNVIGIGLPVATGVVQGHIFTAPVLMAAGASLAMKLAASPLDHSMTAEDRIAVATQAKKLAEAVEAAKRG